MTELADNLANVQAEARVQPRIYTRDEHAVSRKFISDAALKVLYRLNKAGYQAYLVGGSVRDLLLGREPKDFDIATDALPEQVRELFRNCRLIGRRFRLAHVQFGQEIIEVATFRAQHDADAQRSAVGRRGPRRAAGRAAAAAARGPRQAAATNAGATPPVRGPCDF